MKNRRTHYSTSYKLSATTMLSLITVANHESPYNLRISIFSKYFFPYRDDNQDFKMKQVIILKIVVVLLNEGSITLFDKNSYPLT